jgi:cyclopentanol dehydrogenase
VNSKTNVAFITDNNRGIGLETARELGGHGFVVVIGARETHKGEAAVQTLRSEGVDAEAIIYDAHRPETDRSVLDHLTGRYGKLDVLVNNAGIISEGGAVDEPEDVWNRVIAVNQTGVFLGMKHVVPAMRRAGGGSIVNIASTLGIVGTEDYIAYQASKGAVRQMTKSAALSYVGDGIRVNTICPGFVSTPMTDALGPEIHEHDVGMTPMGRPGQPIEVSHAVVFLASDEASFVTGTELCVDGGYLAQ